jgi:hypothetical protein
MTRKFIEKSCLHHAECERYFADCLHHAECERYFADQNLTDFKNQSLRLVRRSVCSLGRRVYARNEEKSCRASPFRGVANRRTEALETSKIASASKSFFFSFDSAISGNDQLPL